MPLGALLVEIALRGWVEHIPFVLFFLVVALVGSIGGWGPGLVSVAVSALAGWYFLATSASASRASAALIGAALFTPVGLTIAAFGAMVRTGFREREEAIALRDEFITTASHELNTPLTSLALITAQIRRVEAQGDPAATSAALLRHLGAVHRQTARLSALVENLLDVSRLTSGRIHLALQPVDLAQVVREVGERFEGELREKRLALEIDAPGPVVGTWDPVRLDQVMTNLVSNAVKYGDGKPIRVSVRADRDHAVAVVADDGPGISPEDQARIFGRFERGASASGRGGFGLGLWIVQEIVAALGGRVDVASAPGQGATFKVALPLAGPRDGAA